MTPVKTFLRNSIAEDMAWSYGQMIADEMVFMLLKPEFDKLKEKFNE
jgi:hypothetical protein